MKAPSARVGVAEGAVVVPDRAIVEWVGFEEKLRRGDDARRRFAAKGAGSRFAGLLHRQFNIEVRVARSANKFITWHGIVRNLSLHRSRAVTRATSKSLQLSVLCLAGGNLAKRKRANGLGESPGAVR